MGIGVFAVEDFDNATQTARCTKQPLALTVKLAFTGCIEGALVTFIEMGSDSYFSEVTPEVASVFSIFR
ncbi:hypothetical protein, partial [Pseudomonas bubulae]|uniref:hypothetical protein n=1 Tax=Pseudomonas bubulae TaxID=2316085 RepID=UPI003F9857BB